MKERDRVHRKYKASVNMTCAALKRWAEDPCSRKASLSRRPINRNLRLLCKPKSEWTAQDIRDAKRTIAFTKRMRGVKAGKPAAKGCPSKKTISLRNWAFDPER